MLGDLVNVVARHLREQTGNYFQEIRRPALKLLGLYGIQVSARETCQSSKQLHNSLCQESSTISLWWTVCQHMAVCYNSDKAAVSMCSGTLRHILPCFPAVK